MGRTCLRNRTVRGIIMEAMVLMVFVVSAHAIEPCPVVTDASIAQKAEQWVSSFKEPYCSFLKEYQSKLLQQKVVSGMLAPPSVFSGLFRDYKDGAGLVVRPVAGTRYFRSTDSSAKAMAAAKVRAIRTDTAIARYEAAKKAYGLALRADKVAGEMAPYAFDVSSKHQAQKDAVRLAHMIGLIEAQGLKLLSFSRMSQALEEGTEK